jgi:hypothetical protein
MPRRSQEMQENPTIEEILAQTRLLSLEDRAILLEQLRSDLLQQTTALLQRIEGQHAEKDAEPLLDIREFRGIGHGTWTDIGGVDEFIKQERASWDS